MEEAVRGRGVRIKMSKRRTSTACLSPPAPTSPSAAAPPTLRLRSHHHQKSFSSISSSPPPSQPSLPLSTAATSPASSLFSVGLCPSTRRPLPTSHSLRPTARPILAIVLVLSCILLFPVSSQSTDSSDSAVQDTSRPWGKYNHLLTVRRTQPHSHPLILDFRSPRDLFSLSTNVFQPCRVCPQDPQNRTICPTYDQDCPAGGLQTIHVKAYQPVLVDWAYDRQYKWFLEFYIKDAEGKEYYITTRPFDATVIPSPGRYSFPVPSLAPGQYQFWRRYFDPHTSVPTDSDARVTHNIIVDDPSIVWPSLIAPTHPTPTPPPQPSTPHPPHPPAPPPTEPQETSLSTSASS
ncbi:hypothetical protein BC829DRAFT_89564 [Chytridium lagenaria]|nr:hypothetical protein BC829DRAFT_89564 [Chytridium lagenaria]